MSVELKPRSVRRAWSAALRMRVLLMQGSPARNSSTVTAIRTGWERPLSSFLLALGRLLSEGLDLFPAGLDGRLSALEPNRTSEARPGGSLTPKASELSWSRLTRPCEHP